MKRNKELIATEVQVVAKSQKNGLGSRSNNYPLCQGFIAALKDSFGFIETIEHDREVFFHFRYNISIIFIIFLTTYIY